MKFETNWDQTWIMDPNRLFWALRQLFIMLLFAFWFVFQTKWVDRLRVDVDETSVISFLCDVWSHVRWVDSLSVSILMNKKCPVAKAVDMCSEHVVVLVPFRRRRNISQNFNRSIFVRLLLNRKRRKWLNSQTKIASDYVMGDLRTADGPFERIMIIIIICIMQPEIPFQDTNSFRDVSLLLYYFEFFFFSFLCDMRDSRLQLLSQFSYLLCFALLPYQCLNILRQIPHKNQNYPNNKTKPIRKCVEQLL